MRQRIPSKLKCDWRKAELTNGIDRIRILPWGSNRHTGTWMCKDCKMWTANLPLYKNQLCSAKDRRKGKADRREP